MDEKPTAILKAEEVTDTAVVTPPVKTEETWSKFPPQVEDASSTGKKSSKGLWLVVIVLLIVALGVVGFIIYKGDLMSKSQIEATPTPTPASEPSPTEVPPTPAITDKSEVTIQILNGSGVVGQASKIAAALEKQDFRTPEVANFDGDKQTETMVKYTVKVDKSLVDELVTVLEESLSDVTATPDATLTDFDILVITGSSL